MLDTAQKYYIHTRSYVGAMIQVWRAFAAAGGSIAQNLAARVPGLRRCLRVLVVIIAGQIHLLIYSVPCALHVCQVNHY